jgi:hypothetical protein
MATINVGDLVRITDRGHSYPNYREMYRAMGFANDNEQDNPYYEGQVLRVFDIKPLPHNTSITLYGLRPVEGGQEILMNNNGIEYVFPGNWHIKITEENNEMLGNWREAGGIRGLQGIILSEYRETRGYWMGDDERIPTHCQIEITTEQFIEYVLNQTDTNMPQELTPEQQYDAALSAMNLQPGDVVRVTHRTEYNYRGWNNIWGSDMDAFIGNEYQVRRISGNRSGVNLIGIPYNFPIYSLELVRRANDPIPTPEPTSNLENEAQDEVVVTTDKVICLTDKWNYVNLGGVYEVTNKDEYYTYVKDEVGGESRYAHHYFEEWVDAETKAKRDSFKALFGDHSRSMFKNSGDDVQKLLAELYPKLYEYRGWINLKKDINHESKWLFDNQIIRLVDESHTDNERLHGTMQYDPSDYYMEIFTSGGHNYIRFKHR